MPAAATCCSPSSAASSSTATRSATARRCCASTATCRAPSSTSCSRPRSPTARRPAGGGCPRSAPASACHGALLEVAGMTADRNGAGARRTTNSPCRASSRAETLDRARARRSGGAALAPRPAPRQRVHGRAPDPARALRAALRPQRGGGRCASLEIGCGDGRLLLGVARRRGTLARGVESICSIDSRWSTRRRSPRYAALGWHARRVGSPTCSTGPRRRGERWDVDRRQSLPPSLRGRRARRVLGAVAAARRSRSSPASRAAPLRARREPLIFSSARTR